MGIYSRDTDQQLQSRRSELSESLHKRLTQPTSIEYGNSHGSSRANYAQQTDAIKRQIAEIDRELDRRAGLPSPNSPFYLV